MKNLISFLLISLLACQVSFAQTDVNVVTPTNDDNSEVYKMVEVMPSFKGCEKEETEQKRSQCTMQKVQEHLAKNIIYPEESMGKGIAGTVYISFVVDERGNVANVYALRGVNDELDQEAVRVVKLLPPFNPGMQKGKNVKVQYALPVKYLLKEN